MIKFKPILLHLPDTEVFRERYRLGMEHFTNIGLAEYSGYSILPIAGIHAERFGIQGTHPYLGDDPNRTIPQGQKDIGSYLSHYLLYNVCIALDHAHYMILEDDARFCDGWKERLTQAFNDVPKDFDVLMVGSCCAVDKPKEHVRGEVWEVKYPMCGHCYIVAKKALGTFITTQRDTCNPTDISLNLLAFPHLKVYTILPRIAGQHNNDTLSQ